LAIADAVARVRSLDREEAGLDPLRAGVDARAVTFARERIGREERAAAAAPLATAANRAGRR
jgi:hypothetical protein